MKKVNLNLSLDSSCMVFSGGFLSVGPLPDLFHSPRRQHWQLNGITVMAFLYGSR